MNNETQAASTHAPANPIGVDQIEANVIAALRTIFDPEIPVNIYDLGLIYGLDIDAAGKVDIRMTLTAPACPVAGTFPGTVEERLYEVPGVTEVRVELVWEPAWSMNNLSEDAKLQLGLL
jgi:FeS assembly SUF system protein